jgi:molecular chaperone DnaK (HSP70)
MFNKTKPNYGIDIGNNKITISRVDVNPIPEIVPDTMDLRHIPNNIMFLSDPDQLRTFGNSAVPHKSFESNQYSLQTHQNIQLGDINLQAVPGFIIKNMIMTHVKNIIRSRYPVITCAHAHAQSTTAAHGFKNYPANHNDLNPVNTQPCTGIDNMVIVPSYSVSCQDMYFNLLGAKCILGVNQCNSTEHSKIIALSNINAIIMAYLGKYIISIDSKIDMVRKNVLIIDAGHQRTNFILFTVSRKHEIVTIEHRMVMTERKVAGELIDDMFTEYMINKTRQTYPGFAGDDIPFNRLFRSAVIKLKHQLSTNQSSKFVVENGNHDISINTTRAEFEDVIRNRCIDKTLMDGIQLLKKCHSIDHIELIGGLGRIPFLAQIIDSAFSKVYRSMNPDETVANGGALFGYLLKNPVIARTIQIIREIQETVSISYMGRHMKRKVINVFEQFEKISSTFHLTALEQENLALHNAMQKFADEYPEIKPNRVHEHGQANYDSDIKMIRINSMMDDTFVVKMENLEIVVTLKNISLELNSYFDIWIAYNLADLVEVVNIKDPKNNIVNFDIVIRTGLNSYPDNSIDQYVEYERMIIGREKINETRQHVINFMEGYYYDEAGFKNLMRRIKTKINGELFSTHVKSLKEAREFYNFCSLYVSESTNEYEIEKKRYIETLLHDDHALEKLGDAVQIIKNIQTKYA